ncbi:MAG: hypothetical protein QOI04_1118 [Verrucomicrobiota bacterium]|jgi:Tfp pilus assembly protein PilF
MSDFMLTDEERRLKRRKRRRLVVILAILLLLCVAGFFGARPGMNAIKAFQARRHANKAFALIAQEKWLDARNEAVAAYQLRPTEPQALRAVARFLSRTHQADALDFWKHLAEKVSLTREDLRDEASIAIIAGDATRAEATVRELTAKDAQPADWLLAAQLSIQKGAPEDARASLEKVFNDARASEREQFQAAVLQLTSSTNPDHANDAWSRVEKISRGTSATALDALVVLARRALGQKAEDEGRKAEVSELARQLESHPLAKAPHKLLALDLLEHHDATQRDTLVARGIAQWKDADAESLTVLATWLNGKGEYQRELDTIPLEKALQARDLFLQHLDALGALGRWIDIKNLLGDERYPLDQVVQRMYLARCSAQLGEKTAAENNWKRALEAAGGDPGKLMTVAEYAEKNGIVDVADSAYNAAVAQAPKLRPAQQGRLRIAQASGDTKKIHAVLADMLAFWPNDPAIENDEGYTRLLLMPSQQSQVEGGEQKSEVSGESSDELKQIEELAEKLVQHEPASLPHRTLLALARLRQNRAADALAVYANLNVANNALTPSALSVHAAVLAANGKFDDARNEAKQIKIDNLLPEEKDLIKNLQNN